MMPRMLVNWLVAFIVFQEAFQVSSVVSSNTDQLKLDINGEVFFALCDVVGISRAKLPDELLNKTDWTSDYDDIMAFNMSVADSEWRAYFTEAKEGETRKQAWNDEAKEEPFKSIVASFGSNEPAKNSKIADWKDKWKMWYKAQQKSSEKSKSPAEKKWQDKYPPIASEDDRKLRKEIVTVIAQQAYDLKQKSSTVRPQSRAIVQKEMRKAFSSAICKADATSEEVTNTDGTCKEKPTELEFSKVCNPGKDTGGHKAIIADAFACACCPRKNSEAECDKCISGLTNAKTNADSSSQGQKYTTGALDEIMKKCPSSSTTEYSNEAMAAALNTIQVNITEDWSKSARFYLGETPTAAATCGLVPAGKSCIDYSEYFTTKGKKGLGQIHWVEQIKKGMNKFKEILRDDVKESKLHAEMASLRRAAEREYMRIYPEVKTIIQEVPITTAAPTTTTTPAPSQAQSQTENPKKNHDDHKKVCDETKDDETKCKEQKDHCKFTDEKKCVPISEEPKAIEETRKPGTAKSTCPILPIVAVLL